MISQLVAALLLLQAVISVKTELVTVPVIVTDARGQPVSGLSEENFRVLEDRRPQPIAVFHRGDGPITLGLIVDRSQSMGRKTAALHAAVSALLQVSRPDDELFGVAFNDAVSFALPGERPFASHAKELEAALAAVHAEGRTALYDGVAEGLQRLRLGRAGRSALVIVSDGGDNASRRTYPQIRALARESDAVIYGIGLLGSAQAEEEENVGLLKRLCGDTGGIAYFPNTAAEIAAAAGQIARDLREQYILGFAPGAAVDRGGFHRIQVRVTVPGQERLHVRARAGYVVTAPNDEKHTP